MAAVNPQPDPHLASLPLPLRHVGVAQVLPPRELMDGRLFGSGECRSRFRSSQPRVECTLLDVAGLPLLVGRTTPIDAWERSQGAFSVTMCY